MKIGDKIRIIRIPESLPVDEMKTQELFEQCLGRIFPIIDIEEGFIKLNVGEIRGRAPYMESIFIEQEYVELIS